MGMYTEIVVGVRLKKGTPKEVMDILSVLVGYTDASGLDLPSHGFFKTNRWKYIVRSCSYYFPVHSAHSRLVDDGRGNIFLDARASLKNYDSEIEKFFDWLLPYVEAHYGCGKTLMGYSRYEENGYPILYFKDNETGRLDTLETSNT